MISRAHMRRQLRANGGITNARQGYGIGSWVKERVRKLIPNELANVAVKAAPFVAMLPGYGPLAAGIMRGVGRFDQRGSISDALKQGVGTYAGGKVFGKGMEAAKFRTPGGSAIDSLKELPSKFMEKGSEFLNKGIDTLNKSGTTGEILKGQLLVGGGTAIASFIASQFAEDPQQPGESYSEYMARRKPVVEKNLKIYLGQSNPGMSQEDLDKLVQQNLAEYIQESSRTNNNQGGRVGYDKGDMVLPMKKPKVNNPDLTYSGTGDPTYTGNNLDDLPRGLQIDTTTSNPIPDNAAELEIAEVAKIMIGPGRSGIGEPEDGTMKGYQFFRTQYLPKKIKEISENYGLSRIEILKMIRAEMMKYSKPKKEKMNKGGLMRLNYMIGGEAKQMEAGAPPIIYSGNMDPNAPNQQAGLPAVPGPMQMAPDGPEFDMRENGGFQPLGRQEGKDDVPAMLAKNEFVMTADAVRAAGGGSVQKGAQRMYDTMKKLESRVS